MSQCLRCVMGAMMIGATGMTATAQFVVHVSPQNLGTIKGVSNDGLVAGENTLGRLYRWRPGMVEISPILGSGVSVRGVTAQSSTVLVQNLATSPSRVAMWTGTDLIALPALPASISAPSLLPINEITAASADGVFVFGTFTDRDTMPPQRISRASPWVWTQSSGYTELPTPTGDPNWRHGWIQGASSNGNFVVGRSGPDTDFAQPTLWSRNETGWTLTALPFPSGITPSVEFAAFDPLRNIAVGVSQDGRVALGSIRYTTSSGQSANMFVRWVDGDVAQTLATSGAANLMQLSDDGQLALLRVSASSDVIWQSDGSTVPVLDYLTQMGAVFPDGASLSLVRMSADGRTFAGRIAAPSLDTFRQFVVTIPTPATLPLLALAGVLAARRRR